MTWLLALSGMLTLIGVRLVVARAEALREGRWPARYAQAMSRPARLLLVVAVVAAALAFIAWLAGRG